MKELRVTKNNKEVKIEYNWGDLERKKRFLETTTHKISETNSSFHDKKCTTGKV